MASAFNNVRFTAWEKDKFADEMTAAVNVGGRIRRRRESD
jgi:hypothetical protein